MYTPIESINQILNFFQQRNKELAIDVYDVVDSAYQVIREVGNLDDMWFYKGVELEINKDGIAELPCNVYKVDYVFLNGREATPQIFNVMEESIRFNVDNPEKLGKLEVDYYAIPSDEDGIPIIESIELAEAVYWYHLYYAKMDSYLSGDMPQNRWNFLEEKKDHYMVRAKMIYRKITKNHRNRLHKIMLNVRPKIAAPRGRGI